MKTELEIAIESCREAWKSNPRATHAWCCHHEVLCEKLTEPAGNRIKYILFKPMDEQVVRLNNFRPIIDMKGFLPEWKKYNKIKQSAYAEYEKIRQSAWDELCEKVAEQYQREVPLGTWNGKSIF